jgi:TPR repeat protein
MPEHSCGPLRRLRRLERHTMHLLLDDAALLAHHLSCRSPYRLAFSLRASFCWSLGSRASSLALSWRPSSSLGAHCGRFKKTNAVGFEEGEQIKWWDALDALYETCDGTSWEKATQMVRECRHPDAQWLAALLPATGVAVTRECVRQVLLGLSEDARAIDIAWRLSDKDDKAPLRRAAMMGYAPAQAQLSRFGSIAECFELAQKAAAAGNRSGIHQLGSCYQAGMAVACTQDTRRAIALFQKAADLGCPRAQMALGYTAYDELDWQRYDLFTQAALRGHTMALRFVGPGIFMQGKNRRILHIVASCIRPNFDITKRLFFGHPSRENHDSLVQVLQFHDAMLGVARPAIDCWSIAARRRGIVKDIRVMIAKIAWEEVWLWGEVQKRPVQQKKANRRR